MKRTAVALKDACVPFALAGGYAAWARGGPRSDHDVDFFIAEEDVDRARTALQGAGLEVREPPEDWLFKAFDQGEMVDLIFRPSGFAVTKELLERATDLEVDSVRMPVITASDLFRTKLHALNEHYCNFGSLLPDARALREQVDWAALAEETSDNPYASAFLFLLRRLGVIAE